MDKEIEELLHSLDLDVPLPSPEGEIKLPREQQKKPFCFRSLHRIFSCGGWFLVGLLSSLTALYSYHYFTRKELPLPHHVVELPSYHHEVFLKPKHNDVLRLSLIASPSIDETNSVGEKRESNKEEAFFAIPSEDEKALVAEMHMVSSSLNQAKQGIFSLLQGLRPLEEKEVCLLLAKTFDSFLRSRLIVSSELEQKLEEKRQNGTCARTPLLLYMTLFGAMPHLGCTELVQSAQAIRQEIDQLFESLKRSRTIEDQSFIASKVLKVFEKVRSDRLLSTLIEIRDDRRRLDRYAQEALDRFQIERDRCHSMKEVRAISLFENCLMKKEVMPWKQFERHLHVETQTLSVYVENHLALSNGFSSYERLDWADTRNFSQEPPTP